MSEEIIRVFVCYAHADRQWLADDGLIPWLQKNLRRRDVEFWWDREKDEGLRGGDEWRKRIFSEIDRAHLALLLISDDFAASEFIRNDELPRIRRRSGAEGLDIVPVLARRVSMLTRDDLLWLFEEVQIVPGEKLPLVACKATEQKWEETRTDLLDTLHHRIQQLRARSTPPRPPATARATPVRTAATVVVPAPQAPSGEAARLLAELEQPETTHARRAEIGDRLDRIGDPRPGVGLRADGIPDIAWCPIPAGRVTLENGAGTFDVEPFEIAKYPITYSQYRAFLEDGDGYRAQRWWKDLRQEDSPGQQMQRIGNCPAERVSWYDAVAFCRWLSARLGHGVRLPTEWEWQQAATGGRADFEYPWGKKWRDGLANTEESGLGRTTAVGMYLSPVFAQQPLDLAGNVWEWCANKYRSARDVDIGGDAPRVVRGGSWYNYRDFARCAYRSFNEPALRSYNLGFRVVRVSPI